MDDDNSTEDAFPFSPALFPGSTGTDTMEDYSPSRRTRQKLCTGAICEKVDSALDTLSPAQALVASCYFTLQGNSKSRADTLAKTFNEADELFEEKEITFIREAFGLGSDDVIESRHVEKLCVSALRQLRFSR